MKLTYLSLGSNLGDRADNLLGAIAALEAGAVRVSNTSPVYETEPVDYRDQSWFLNQVLEAWTALDPPSLLAFIAQIEHALWPPANPPNRDRKGAIRLSS